ncbi:m-AAA protease-interacting protein 1, mitochondrial-like, partial [Acipenser ruthenus]|uniref:m-AAA protease-interacting protein 1, mitochondrial-like n=1 Tax=Acipenser ruthenus TaxID=7906 RepID=UPI002741C085
GVSALGLKGSCPIFSNTAALNLSVDRLYSSETQRTNQKVVVVGIPNPFFWCRTRVYYFLIWAYFDQEFNIDDFTCGFFLCIYLITPLVYSRGIDSPAGLAADMSDIMYTTPGDVGIYYDENGWKFVSILMRFWYLTSARLPEETPEGTKVFQVVFGEEEGGEETKRLLTANYEFQREFTKGVLPDWTITRIEHSKLLD